MYSRPHFCFFELSSVDIVRSDFISKTEFRNVDSLTLHSVHYDWTCPLLSVTGKRDGQASLKQNQWSCATSKPCVTFDATNGNGTVISVTTPREIAQSEPLGIYGAT